MFTLVLPSGRLHASKVEQVFDQAAESRGLTLHEAQVKAARRLVGSTVVRQQLRHVAKRRQRTPELVRDRGDEVGLQHPRFLPFPMHTAETQERFCACPFVARTCKRPEQPDGSVEIASLELEPVGLRKVRVERAGRWHGRMVEQSPVGRVRGDEILAVDGEGVAARARRLEQCNAFSTPASRIAIVPGRLLAGEPGSVARVAVRGANGQSRDVEFIKPVTPGRGVAAAHRGARSSLTTG